MYENVPKPTKGELFVSFATARAIRILHSPAGLGIATKAPSATSAPSLKTLHGLEIVAPEQHQ